MAWLINPAQLDKFRKNQKNIVILDASYFLDADKRNPREEFNQSHIIGARFFDLTAFNDTSTSLPNMLTRDENLIRQKVGELGITNEHKIFFYDNSPLHSSFRALWMFKVFGHNTNQLYLLDGGFEAWKREGGKVESGEVRNAAKNYNVNYQAHLIRTLMQMKTNLHHPTEQVVDLRHPVRYAGGPEARSNLRSGHIKGSYCFPYTTMFEPDGHLKNTDKLRKQLFNLGLELEAPIVTMCGSGITSAILNFVLDLLNHENHFLYDGSWAEWGNKELYLGEESLSERPVVTSLDS